MTDERQRRIKQLLDALMDLTPEDRAAYLDEHCNDPAIRSEVESLLQFHHDETTEIAEHVRPPVMAAPAAARPS